ncbi:MAG: glycosyltransferase family 9 protein, partial [Isosphaeraceae bacterium]
LATLRQTTAILSRCRLFIGNDSGPMHLASAVGVPVVEISMFPRSGPRGHVSSPHRFGPWGVPSVIVQPSHALPPCTDGCRASTAHCITQVGVSEVFVAVMELLERTSDRLSPESRAPVAQGSRRS